MTYMKHVLLAFLMAVAASTACAQGFYDSPLEVDAYGYVKDRYTIFFQPRREGETPIVWPPNPANSPPFPLHSSGQDPDSIEAALALNGDVIAILDVINAVFVRMSAREAERLRQDPRVVYIEQDQMLYAQGGNSGTSPPPPPLYAPQAVPPANAPQLYRSERFTLSLPAIDHNGIPGFYQDATIEYLPEKGAWRLYDYRRAVPVAEIREVSVRSTVERPAQVFLRISGEFADGCRQVGDVGLRQDGPAFKVYLYYRAGSEPSGQHDCTAGMVPFSVTVPLPVYGLVAGTYTYDVNGRFIGSFTLAADNVLPPLLQ